ncbi:hypothetical protein AAFC00_001900 [Neodothiora populina]|uniref:Kinesin motor domain-containing protein n=1 Tax=Neodothiora populina TaxID=2781224 RepID=A0ABR3PQJ7_9PEZI
MDAMSQPGSPAARSSHRPSIGGIKTPRSSSRMSVASSRHSIAGPGALASRSSDEDSKTAVKVAIRVRPPLNPSDPGFELIPQRFRHSTCEVPSPTNLIVASPQGKKLFVFDRVFDEDTNQEGVWNYLSDSVNSFVQGYNVSILAYGQSGAGKSYTMGTAGSEQVLDSSGAGVIPRAAQLLFEKLQGPSPPKSGLRSPQRYSSHGIPAFSPMHKQQPSLEKDWQLKATYVEIYNEQLRDLLVPETVPQGERPQVSIREDTKGRILLTGLTSIPVNSVDDLLHALHFGSAIRQTDATAINAKSSRSHAVFSLNLIQKKGSNIKDRRLSAPLESMTNQESSSVTIDSKLHFVDLAGSERLKNTGAQGERAREGISINAGLASLGKVISQLSSRHPGGYVSYRDSRLTRLLQDSLGGNAITYMVACVTPAEFHLSETLNTVTYAQRARAIQSKPEIQQTHEDKDSGAKLERLQAEVAFLRDQIKHERSSEERNPSSGDPLSARREKELQDQLLDMQESYNALSQRHAKLIAEIARARDDHDEEMPTVRDAIGESAMERLKRSNSLSQAVEQVVVEYEKTIQSLETSLSNTRATLSNSESVLMERESKIAYMESLAQQLQSRLQKTSDRESNNDAYLRELEAQIEGATSSEEKSASLVASLRKELSRIKDNESNAEEYISTLEERLAEAEQDQEIMQREIDRLEQVIQRQRSIGRLDNLLADLDGIRQREVDTKAAGLKPINGHSDDSDPSNDATNGEIREQSEEREVSPTGDVIPEEDTDDVEERQSDNPQLKVFESQGASGERPVSHEEQSSFMADKLESTMQELFDLRGEHEATINEKHDLQRKYEVALQTLAKLQEEQQSQSSAEPSRPQSFLGHAGVNINAMVEGQGPTSSSRSLESELSSSLQGSHTLTDELNTNTEMSTEVASDSEGDHHTSEVDATNIPLPEDSEHAEHDEVSMELESLRKLHTEQQDRVRELTASYDRLQQNHRSTLSQVEDLNKELSRMSNALRPSSPHSPGLRSPTLRRKLSQDLVSSMTNNDRTTRSFASLRNLALDNFEENIDARQNFELHLNTIMADLHDRNRRVEALDGELQSMRKDIETNQKIITGLTRERSSLQASSGVDLTVVGQMQSQLEYSEQQLRFFQEMHANKEREWQNTLVDMKVQLRQSMHIPVSPAGTDSGTAGLDSQIAQLQAELSDWETRHNAAMTSMKASEAALLATIAALEASKKHAEQDAHEISDRYEHAASSFGKERAINEKVVGELRKKVAEYQSANEAHEEHLSKLEDSHAAILQQVEEQSKSKALVERDLKMHRELVSNLESQLDSHKATIAVHEANLENILSNLKNSHTSEIERMREEAQAAEKEASDRHALLLEQHSVAMRELEEQHKTVLSALQQDLSRKQEDLEELLNSASAVLGHETDVGRFQGHLHDAFQRRGFHDVNEWQEKHARAIADGDATQKELQETVAKCNALESKLNEMAAINDKTLQDLEIAAQDGVKKAHLIEELEDQITNNFDRHEAATKRLSAMEGRQAELEESLRVRRQLEKELEDARAKLSMLESPDARHRSLASTSRESFGRDSTLTFNRDSLSPEAAAIALARTSTAGSLHNVPSNPNARPRSNHNGATGQPTTALPSPPPAIPLPPLPGSPPLGSNSPKLNHHSSIDARAASPSGMTSKSRSPPGTPQSPFPPSSTFAGLPPFPPPPHSSMPSALPDPALQAKLDEQDSRLRTLEKHLFAEKQLTATLEEALVDLENSTNKHKVDSDAFKRRCKELEDELVGLRKERTNSRASLQQVEEEREMRLRAERARTALEERMKELNNMNGAGKKKKKGGALNCF